MDLQRCLVLAVQPTAAAAGVNTVSSELSSLSGEVGVVQRSSMPGVFRGIGVNTYSIAAELTSSNPTDSNATAVTASTTPAPYLSAARRTFLDYCQQLAFELNAAMREESLTIDYLTSVPASMTGPMQGLHNAYSTSSGGSRALDSLVDLAFIRDLHCATVQLMTLRLLEQADKLDFRTRIIEQKCARLMTLLKPSFVRAKLELPVPPMSRSITHYELRLERTAIGESCTVDVWKLVLLRARRKCREVLQLRGQVAIGGGGNSSNNNSMYDLTPDTRTETQIVLDCITEQFVTWAREEYKQRLYRKINSVKDRLETIHAFRIQLILNLHERFVVNGTTNANASTGWFSGNTDLTYQRSIREKFPFLDLTEPVLFDTNAILLSSKYGMYDAAAAALNGKTGTMYLSLGYVMFYCGGGFLGTPAEIVVVPLHSVVLLELVGSDGTLVCFSYSTGEISSVVDSGGVGSDGREGLVIQQGDKSVNILLKINPNATNTPSMNTTNTNTINTTTTSTKPHIAPSAKQPSTIRLVDSTGTVDVTLTVTGLTEDYVRRVADLLDLIIKDKMYKLREPHATPLSAASTTTNTTTNQAGASTYHTISDIDDILDLLALPTSGDSRSDGGSAGVDGNDSSVVNSSGDRVSTVTKTNANITEGVPLNSDDRISANASVSVSNQNSGNSGNRTPALLNTSIPSTTTSTSNTTLPARAVLTNRPATTVSPSTAANTNTHNLKNTTHTTSNSQNATNTSTNIVDADFDNLLLSTTHSTTIPTNTTTNASDISAFGFINSSSDNIEDLVVTSPFDNMPSLLIPTTSTNAMHTNTTNSAALPNSTSPGVQRSDSSHLADLDNFYNELTIHTPTSSVGNTGTHTPTYAASGSAYDVFGSSSVLVPNSGVLSYTNSNTSSSNMLLHSGSTNMLNTMQSNSRSNNSISNINIDLTSNPNSSKSTGELFNDLIFGTVGSSGLNKAPSASTPKIGSPSSNSSSGNKILSGTAVSSSANNNSIVRTPALSAAPAASKPAAATTATATPVVKPVPATNTTTTTTTPKVMPATTTATINIKQTTAAATPTAPVSAAIKSVASTPAPIAPSPGPAPTPSSTASNSGSTTKSITATTTTSTTTGASPAAAVADQPAPAPVKKSLGGNIQKFLAQSQAQKAKQLAVPAEVNGDKK